VIGLAHGQQQLTSLVVTSAAKRNVLHFNQLCHCSHTMCFTLTKNNVFCLHQIVVFPLGPTKVPASFCLSGQTIGLRNLEVVCHVEMISCQVACTLLTHSTRREDVVPDHSD